MSSLNAAKPTEQISTETHGSPNFSPSVTEDEVDGNALPQVPSQLSDSFGHISLENTETSYVESTHWTTILDGVRHFRPFAVNVNGSLKS